MTTTALAGLATAIYCEGLLRDFGIVMATGAIFGMMSTVAIVVGVMRFHYRRQEQELLMNPPAVASH
jgi:preprotein translocase subunit SecF